MIETAEKWKVCPVRPEEVTAEYLFEVFKKHRLIPENLADAIEYYRRVAVDCRVVRLMDDVDGWIADVIFTEIIPKESATVTMIPKPCFFASGSEFEEPTRQALATVFEKLMSGHHLRRLNAFVPESRNRTVKALRACGFKKEGVMRNALKFNRKPAEDMVIMGLLPED